ncbi:MAG: hypothetical protein Fur0032_09680 [Terrimicrobiaceae bacterium]
MIFRTGFLGKMIVLLGLATQTFLLAGEPDASTILEAARLNPMGRPVALDARLRVGRETTPFRIVVDGSVRYEFDNPSHVLELALAKEGSNLTEQKGGKTSPVRPARFDERVRNSDISYEDLSLAFLYWPHPKIIGEEIVNTRRCWKIEMQAPRKESQYGVARVWIDQSGGALLRMEGFDKSGRLVRRFSVTSAQQIDGQWMLRQMRIESINPETRKTLSRSYLEVTGKAE